MTKPLIRSLFLANLILLSPTQAAGVGSNGAKHSTQSESSPTVDAGAAAGPQKSVSNSKELMKCMSSYQDLAKKVCRAYKNFNLTPDSNGKNDQEVAKAKALVADVRKKMDQQLKDDNMYWSDKRIKEGNAFLSSFGASSSPYRVSQERWCTLAAENKDETEKASAWVEERCRSKNLTAALNADSKELVDLDYMFNNLASVGLDHEARASKAALQLVEQYRAKLSSPAVAGGAGALNVEKIIDELAKAKDTAGMNPRSSSAKATYLAKLKACYALERENAKAFKKSGYDCSSFDLEQNP